MVRRQIDFDEETDRMLAELARDYDGAWAEPWPNWFMPTKASKPSSKSPKKFTAPRCSPKWNAQSGASMRGALQRGKRLNAVIASDQAALGSLSAWPTSGQAKPPVPPSSPKMSKLQRAFQAAFF